MKAKAEPGPKAKKGGAKLQSEHVEAREVARPNRRDEEDQARRIMDSRLVRAYGELSLQTAIGKKSQLSVIDFIIVNGLRKKKQQKNISSRSFGTPFSKSLT